MSNKKTNDVFEELSETPAAKPQAEEPPPEKPTQRIDRKLTKYSVLIAEDDTGLQQALSMAAEERNLRVVCASDGIEAATKAANESFDAIIIDMNLPKRLGHEVVTMVRQRGPCQKSTIVVLSGYLKKEVVEVLAGKVDKAFTKPADIDVVLDTVMTILTQKAAKKAG